MGGSRKVYFSDETFATLMRLAEADGSTVSAIIRSLVETQAESAVERRGILAHREALMKRRDVLEQPFKCPHCGVNVTNPHIN